MSSALRKVVLPVEVPPATMMFLRAPHGQPQELGGLAGRQQLRAARRSTAFDFRGAVGPGLGEGAGALVVLQAQVGDHVFAHRQGDRACAWRAAR